MILDALERFDLGGGPQWALVRGQRRISPVLLLVQQGPGFPMIHEAEVMERELHLEENFRVVYWDQRGTGKSVHAGNRHAMTVETLVADVGGMVHALCERLKVRQLDVLGFSIGASLALLACGGDSLPVRSLTCVGPDVDLLESERFAMDFAIAEAGRRHHRRALRELIALGAPPHTNGKQFMTRVKWVSNFGGVDRRKTFWGLFRDNLRQLWKSPRYSVAEVLGALNGMRATQERLVPAFEGFNLMNRPLPVQTPVTVFQGRHDIAAPPRLAVSLAERLNARLVWFENSAHTPHHEEPERFREELLRFVSSVASSPSIRSG